MGITISYKGKLKSPDLIKSIIEEMQDIAKSMGWEYTLLDEDLEKPNTARLEHHSDGAKIVGHLPLKGINVVLHKECESLGLMFDRHGILRDPLQMAFSHDPDQPPEYNFVKTQFAPADVHVTIVKLLKYLSQKYFDEFHVIDEGEYWETGDEELLKQKLQFLSEKIDQVAQIFDEAGDELSSSDSPESLADKIEQLLQEKLFNRKFRQDKPDKTDPEDHLNS